MGMPPLLKMGGVFVKMIKYFGIENVWDLEMVKKIMGQRWWVYVF
jgi:hypothetical protein